MSHRHARWMTFAMLLSSVVLASQVGGLIHLASDLFVEDDHDHCGGCDDEESGLPCPPLCSDCTGAHGARPAVVATASDPVISWRSAAPVVRPEVTHPDDPPSGDIFHPPQRS